MVTTFTVRYVSRTHNTSEAAVRIYSEKGVNDGMDASQSSQALERDPGGALLCLIGNTPLAPSNLLAHLARESLRVA